MCYDAGGKGSLTSISPPSAHGQGNHCSAVNDTKFSHVGIAHHEGPRLSRAALF